MAQIAQFPGTPNFYAMLQPWVAYAQLSKVGAPSFLEIKTRKLVLFDLWELKDEGVINSTDVLIVGTRGSGKTSILKTLPLRLMAWQAGKNEDEELPEYMRVRIDDRKLEQGLPEYTPLTEALHGKVIDLENASINPFDAEMDMDEEDVFVTAVELCEYANKGKPLDSDERVALRIGTWKMMMEARLYASPPLLRAYVRGLNIQDVIDYDKSDDAELRRMVLQMQMRLAEKNNDQEHASQLNNINGQLDELEEVANTTEDELRVGKNKASEHLRDMLKGQYGRFIGGDQSLREILSLDAATFNWTNVPDKARALVESMRMKWEEVALNRNDTSITPHISIGDEIHNAFTDLMHVRFESALARTRRARFTAVFRSTQFETDLTMSGEPDSELRRLAEGIVKSFGMHIIGTQPDRDDIKHELTRTHRLTDEDAQEICDQKVGEFCIVVPNLPPIFTQYILTEADRKLVASDAAVKYMMKRTHPSEFKEALERAKRHDYVLLGQN